MNNRKVNDTRYDNLENLMKQLVPKKKPGRTNLKKNNSLFDRLQSEYQFMVNLTKVNNLSSKSHKFL